MNISPLLDASLIIQFHVAAALVGLFLGPLVLWRRKGTSAHRFMGRIWVAAAVFTALSSFAIWEIRLLGVFSPIHLLSVITLVSLYTGVQAARKGNISLHQRTFKALYGAAFIIPGAFTLLPGRIMHKVLVEPVFNFDLANASGFGRIISGTPIWVWPLLALLIGVGVMASHTRTKNGAQLVPMPLTFACLVIAGLASSNNIPITLAGMVIAGAATYQLGGAIARRQHLRLIKPGRVEVPGEWLTMGIIIVVFVSKFIFGAASGFNPAIANIPIVIVIMGAISGAAFGLSLGRTVVYMRALRGSVERNSATV